MNIFLAALPSHDNRTIIMQKINACEAKRSPLVRVQWTHTQDLHATLGFIPEVDPKDIKQIVPAFNPITQSPAFMAHVAEVKAYGTAIVLRLEPYPHFSALHKKMNHQLMEATENRYQFDTKKRYDPHITIGRIRNLSALNLLHQQQFLSLVQAQFSNYSFIIQQAALLHRAADPHAMPTYETIQLYTLPR
jgi:2'-5' RNA ligase